MIELEHITFACEDPAELATFWQRAVDGERRDLPSFDSEIVDRERGPALLFKEMPKGTERDLPIHLDFAAADRATAVERLTELGASVRETKTESGEGYTATWTVLEDPEGNGFCVTEYE
ncbi:VOC family protein [Halosimplex sp. TS25]|uniref:VOC family protein n=1 Tax=Halosimplex rarum TaxID=3396619 RepID=UPI0039E89D2B